MEQKKAKNDLNIMEYNFNAIFSGVDATCRVRGCTK